MAEQFQFRDVFNAALVEKLASDIHRVWPVFDQQGFVKAVSPKLDTLNFGDRNALIAI